MNEGARGARDPREELFRKLAEELGGEFVDEEGWRQDKVHATAGGWAVTLDFDLHHGYGWECVHTRFHAPVGPTDLHFRIFEQELLSVVARLAGMQDIRIGDPKFDRAFVVQASDEKRLREILAAPELRALLCGEPQIEVTLKPPATGATAAELTIEVPGRVEDGARLRRLYDAFAMLLAALTAPPAK
jgi:hypothetical protein